LDVQIIGEPRAPAALVSWQGPNPQYIFSLFGHRFTGDPLSCESKSCAPGYGTFHPKKRHPQAIKSLGSRCQRELHLSTSHSLRLEGTLCDTSAHQRRRCPRAVGRSGDEPLAHEYSHFSGSHPHFLAVVGVTYRTLQQPQLGPWQLISWNGPSRPISVVQ